MKSLRLLVAGGILLSGGVLTGSCSPAVKVPLTTPACELKPVGGEDNQCRCSQRIEP
ncbi:MAG: hypothetical protein K0U98_22440 [Deltaproteobacteria bacterium]|nr:hypothetical protein [Deltaproteobacteria bacterium]